MTIDQKPNIGVDEIMAALPLAMQLVSPKWLSKQRSRRSAAKELVDPNLALLSIGQTLHAIKVGHPKQPKHPIAECLLAAERNLEDLKNGKPTFPSSVLMTRVLSLRDIALSRDRIPGITERLPKLTSEKEWIPTLHELITAVSYPASMRASLVPESRMTTPDIVLATNPETMIECKSRLQHEAEIEKFVSHWRRFQLPQIAALLSSISKSYLVRAQVDSLSAYQNAPHGAIASGVQEILNAQPLNPLHIHGCRLEIEPFNPEQTSFSVHVPLTGHEIWEHGRGFDEWDQWHYILPFGEVATSSADRRFATGYRRRNVVCVRAVELLNATPSILSTLKNACRLQLKPASVGIIHLLSNTRYFGIGAQRSIPNIMRVLEPEILKAIQDHSRLWKIYIDLATTDDFFDHHPPSMNRLEITNPRASAPTKFDPPSPILLV